MGLQKSVRRWLVGNADQVHDAADEREAATVDSADSDAKTTIEDAEATSLRAIKLPATERDALDADERDP